MNILISHCLLGVPCRWHGRPVLYSPFIRHFLAEHPKAVLIPICPELLGGLTVPRPPVKRRRGHVFETCADKSNRKNITGKDVTAAFLLGAEESLRIAKEYNCKSAILCKWSPSCDITGITGKLLNANGIKVINTW